MKRPPEPDLSAWLQRIRHLSDLANRANVNGGFMAGDPTPIPAVCSNRRCGFRWTGRDAIRAPSLGNVRCFWCGSTLEPYTGAVQGELSLPAGTEVEG